MKIENKIRRSVYSGFLPQYVPYFERFQMAVDAGFEGIEYQSIIENEEVELVAESAKQAGLIIHSVQTLDHWYHPLTSDDPSEVRKGVQATLSALENARKWNADSLLVIPGFVTATCSHAAAWERSKTVIKEQILPVAKDYNVVLAIENEWRGFLPSPSEYARFVDEFESPFVRAYLDIGNIFFGYPEHWIRELGSRIIKLHIKDFTLDPPGRKFGWAPPGDGAVPWTAVKGALVDIKFNGWATSAEVHPTMQLRIINALARRGERIIDSRIFSRQLNRYRLDCTIEMLRDAAMRLERHL